MDYKKLCEQTIEIVKESGNFIRYEAKNFSKDKVETKSLNSLVSYVDKQAEKILVQGLSNVLPNAGFITEEDTIAQEEKEYKWIIDPLDGTTNFIHGIPVYAVSVALTVNQKTVIGVIYEIGRDECFYAYLDGGVYLNEKPISVNTNNDLKNSLIATGFPCYIFDKTEDFFKVLEHLIKNTRGLRRMGSAATDLAYVACGRFDGFFEHSLSAWDVAAGAFIVECAGGRVSDYNGADDYIFGKEIIACNKSIYDDFFKIIHKHFY